MANDIIDINVYETTETVEITVNPNLTTVNINQVTGGGGGGATDLDYTPSPTNGIVTSSTGSGATIPLADGTNAGLFTPSEKTKLSGIAAGAEVNVNADWNATSGDAQILNKPTIPSVSGFVPYTGASANVDLGEYEIKAGQVTLDITPTGSATVATTRWNDALGSSETTLKGGTVVLKNGVDLVARVVNKVVPNTTLTKAAYQAVRVSGATGQRLSVELAQGDVDLNSADTIGLVTETIATNQEGFIITMGQIEEINTTGSLQGETWVDGNVLYLSPTIAGRLTNIKPTGATGHIVVIGYVEYAHAIHGKIYVKIMNGWELDELHNVYINNPLNNQGLFYETSTQLWKNKSIATVLGYTPANDASVVHLTGSETIAGTKTFSSNIVIPGTGSALILGTSSGGTVSGLSTTTYPDLTELALLKGVTGSAIQTQLNAKQPLSTVLTNTTASFTTADETKLDGIAAGATANSSDATLLARANHTGTQLANTISDFNSATRAQVEAELVAGTNITITPSGTGATRQLTIDASGGGSSSQSAFTMLANNTASTAVPTEQVFKNISEQTYTPTPAWSGTNAPSGTTNHTYIWSQVGNLVTLRINLSYSVAGSALTSVALALPSDLPTPETPSSVTTNLDVVNYGNGVLTTTKAALATPVTCYSALRLKTLGTPNIFEIIIARATGAYQYAYASIQYFV